MQIAMMNEVAATTFVSASTSSDACEPRAAEATTICSTVSPSIRNLNSLLRGYMKPILLTT
jgi:hypothetical protein